MKLKCAKCNSICEIGFCIIEAEILYKFCERCANLLQKAPTGNVGAFLGPVKISRWKKKLKLNLNLRLSRLRLD